MIDWTCRERKTQEKREARESRRRALGLALALVAILLWAAAPAAAVAEGEPEESEEAASGSAMEGATEGGGEPAGSQGSVARATFTREVADREPTDRVEVLENDVQQIYYFTELRGFEGRTVTHRWQHAGEVKAEVDFEVGGPRWRVYSSKQLDPSWLGDWTVLVVDAQGQVLRQDRFHYRAGAAEETPEAAPADLP